MKTEKEGYVIICENHPNMGKSYIVSGSFRNYKREAIANFINGSGNTWEYWKRKYNFRCVRATQSITIQELTELPDKSLTECMMGRDGECNHPQCPVTDEDEKNGKYCTLPLYDYRE